MRAWLIELIAEAAADMKAVWYDRRGVAELTRRWRERLRSGELRSRLRQPSAVYEWKRRATGEFLFLADDGSSGGTVELAQPPPVPEQILDQLGIAHGWLIAADLSWAVHADHDGVEPVELLERADGLPSI